VAQSKLVESEKARKKLSTELATLHGTQRYAAVVPDETSMRRAHMEVASIDDDIRAEAQGFTSGPKALLIATSREPISILMAVSTDAGVHAGNRVSEVVKPLGGRGGGNATMAQASLPSLQVLQQVSTALLRSS
jgi:alanyl-tRNA synthetase